jgi:alkylation response protein AidB-like acyl-CoA dehydrogenase
MILVAFLWGFCSLALRLSIACSGKVDNKDCAAVILQSAEDATKTALDAIQCLGGNGYINGMRCLLPSFTSWLLAPAPCVRSSCIAARASHATTRMRT